VISLKELMLLSYSQGKKLMRARCLPDNGGTLICDGECCRYTDIKASSNPTLAGRTDSRAFLRIRQKVFEMLEQVSPVT